MEEGGKGSLPTNNKAMIGVALIFGMPMIGFCAGEAVLNAAMNVNPNMGSLEQVAIASPFLCFMALPVVIGALISLNSKRKK